MRAGDPTGKSGLFKASRIALVAASLALAYGAIDDCHAAGPVAPRTLHELNTPARYQSPSVSVRRILAMTYCPKQTAHAKAGTIQPPVHYTSCFLKIESLTSGDHHFRIGGGNIGAWSPSWSPSGDKLAYISVEGGSPVLTLQFLDRRNRPTVTKSFPRLSLWYHQVPIWLDDDRLIVVTVPTQTASRADGSRSQPRLLTSAPRQQHSPLPVNLLSITVLSVSTKKSETIVDGIRPPTIPWFYDWIQYSRASRTLVYAQKIDDRDVGFDHAYTYHLVSLATESADTRKSSSIPGAFGTSYSLSLNGNLIAVPNRSSNGSCLVILSSETAQVHQTFCRKEVNFDPLHRSLISTAPRWIDDVRVAVIVSSGSEPQVARNAIAFVNVNTGEVNLSKPSGEFELDQILPDYDGGAALNESNAIAVSAVRMTDGQQKVLSVSLLTGQWERLVETRGSMNLFSSDRTLVSNPGLTRLIVSYESLNEPPQIRIVDLHPDRHVTIPVCSSRACGARFFSDSRILTIDGADGKPSKVAVYVPSREYRCGTENLAALVSIYPRPLRHLSRTNFGGAEGSALLDNVHMFVSRCIAVVVPEMRVTRGREIEDITRLAEEAVAEAVEPGLIDIDRVGMMGHSYGGYGVYAAAVSSRLFKAAVVRSGFSSYFNLFAVIGPEGEPIGVFQTEEREIGPGLSPWEATEAYINSSPFFRFPEVSSPILITHGEEDNSSAPVFDAQMSFAALRRLGKSATLLTYPGEDHVEGLWSLENQDHQFRAVLRFLTRYLCGSARDERCN